MLSIGVALGFFLSVMDSSIVATCLFNIALEFGEVGIINWVALAYTLAHLSCAVLYARVSDVVGRRAAFLAAYAIFLAFSIACALSRNMRQLIAFRALQGLGGSGLYSIPLVILPEVTPPPLKKFIGPIAGAAITSSGVLGPVLGGILTHYFGWRSVFWLNGPLGGLSLLVFVFAWPGEEYLPTRVLRGWSDVDYLGSFLLLAGAVLIVFPFQNSPKDGEWSRPTFFAPLTAGVLAFTALIGWQYFVKYHRRRDLAMAFPFELLYNRVYVSTVFHTMFMGFPYFLSMYAFPIRFQMVYGKSALEAGVMLLPILVASAVAIFAADQINRKGKHERFFETMVMACLLSALGCGLEMMASSDEGFEPRVLGFLALIGFGFGLSSAVSTLLAQLASPVQEHATAQAIVAQARILGGSLGIAASSAILGVKIREELASRGINPDMLGYMGLNVSTFSEKQWALIRQVYTDALKEDMIVCCGVLVAGLLCTAGIYSQKRTSVAEMLRKRRLDGEARQTALAAARSGW